MPKQTRSGLVISYFGNSVAVEGQDGQVFQCLLKRNQPLPVVGDKVIWQLENQETGIIVQILPRSSILAKADKRGEMKPIAANIDLAVIVMSPPPLFNEYLLDRYLVACSLLKLPALIVINKIDLVNSDDKELLAQRLAYYPEINYPFIFTSTLTAHGLLSLQTLLTGKTAVLVGPSGVGKSSIIANLSKEKIATGTVSIKGIGKHTTTATKLYHLGEGGCLIDSPGVREFTLWKITQEQLLSGFGEFLKFSALCKFRDCSHLVEPNCAVQQAILDNKISASRMQNYQALLKETVSSQK